MSNNDNSINGVRNMDDSELQPTRKDNTNIGSTATSTSETTSIAPNSSTTKTTTTAIHDDAEMTMETTNDETDSQVKTSRDETDGMVATELPVEVEGKRRRTSKRSISTSPKSYSEVGFIVCCVMLFSKMFKNYLKYFSNKSFSFSPALLGTDFH
jgi:hypothetical protein